MTSPGQRPETIICDGERRWRIGEEEAAAGRAAPPPREIANLFDASWLLEHHLAGGAETVTGGRRGYRLGVTSDDPSRGGMFVADEVVVDAELGIVLCSTSHAGSRPVSRYELRDIAVGEPGDFRADIPDGMRVVDDPDDEPPGPVNPAKVASLIARQAAKDARSAVRNVLGAIRGESDHSGRT